MHPFYFGRSDERLFAIYHAAAGPQIRDVGVVLCYPKGHEYIRSYRAFRNLALQLAAAGFHVLRFDYYGSGDSYGDATERSLARWTKDIGDAVDELKDMATVSKVSMVGLRFGATLASLAASQRNDIEDLVLWDPVATGAFHLQELRIVQEDWFRSRPRPRGPEGLSPRNEILGYPMDERLAAEFERTSMQNIRRWSAKHLTVLMSGDSDQGFDWRAYLGSLPVPATYRVVAGGGEWGLSRSVNRALLAHEMIEAITNVLRGTSAKPSATVGLR